MIGALVVAFALGSSEPPTPALSTASAPRAARLVAQTPPPLPERALQLPASDPTRADALTAELAALNEQLRAINTDWPVGAVALASVGWILSPLTLVGLFLFSIGAVVSSGILVGVGLIVTILGLAGVAMGIAGVVIGISASSQKKAQKLELEKRRRQVLDELSALRGTSMASPLEQPFLATLATF